VELLELDDNIQIPFIISRLLLKEPTDRYQSAQEVIVALSEAIDQPVPPETIAIRDSFLNAAGFVGSFLNAAGFVGREGEVARLKEALAKAIAGNGSTWLIGGESGVGKSRLLNEIRTQALVSGALVLQGQGVVEGGLAYHAWRQPLRRLALAGNLTDLEVSVLDQVIPDIGELVERQVFWSSVRYCRYQNLKDKLVSSA